MAFVAVSGSLISGDQVIREDPAGAVVVRAWPGHRKIGRGSCRSAGADGVVDIHIPGVLTASKHTV